MYKNLMSSTAASATLHCLTGCAIGEILGLMIGTAAGLSNGITVILSIILAFLFGYGLSTLPLISTGMKLGVALSLVLAADTLSIATMEVVDNIVVVIIPGAMNAGLVNPIFWISMALALTAAFFAALPVNKYLIERGRGHALVHEHNHMHDGGDHHEPTMKASPLLYAIAGLIIGGLVVSIADGMTRL